MTKTFKLMSLALVSAFLVGCGSGGGSESGGGGSDCSVDLPSIDGSFPGLNFESYTVLRSVVYADVTNADSYTTTIKGKGFGLQSSSGNGVDYYLPTSQSFYNPYNLNLAMTQIYASTAEAGIVIQEGLSSNTAFIGETLFETVFSKIEGCKVNNTLQTGGDFTSIYSGYVNSLTSSTNGFSPDTSDDFTGTCYAKKDSDFKYIWCYSDDASSMQWTIYRL
jgi:hypothetical protein